jgi:SAM-dependent methyltransferase
MGVKLPRQKPKNPLNSLIYRLSKLPILSNEKKLKLFLNLEWLFDRLAHEQAYKNYTPATHPARIYSYKYILEHIKPTDNVLDLGCNLGDISFRLAEKAKRVVGIDYAPKAIETAKQQYQHPNLEFHCAEAYDYLKKNDARFDVLILSHILEHLDDPKDFLKKFKNFFNYIYIEVPDFDRYYLNHYRKDFKLPIIYSDDDHISEFDRAEIKQLLLDCDIELLESEFIYGVQKFWCSVK